MSLNSTALLASRIWWMDRQGSRVIAEIAGSEHRLHPAVRIILESGLLNAAFLFAFVMTLAFGSSSLEIMSEMVSILVQSALRHYAIISYTIGYTNVRNHLLDRHFPRRATAPGQH